MVQHACMHGSVVHGTQDQEISGTQLAIKLCSEYAPLCGNDGYIDMLRADELKHEH